MVRQPDVKTVAAKLTDIVASYQGVPLPHQKCMNLAAELLGYKNLAHLRQASAAAASFPLPADAPTLPGPSDLPDMADLRFSLFVETLPGSEGPAWAQVSIDAAFMRVLTRMSDLCRAQQLDVVAPGGDTLSAVHVEQWAPSPYGDDWRMEGLALHVAPDEWWLSAYPRHVDDEAQTCAVGLAGLREALEAKLHGTALPDDSYFRWHGDALLHSSTDVVELQDLLLEQGALDAPEQAHPA